MQELLLFGQVPSPRHDYVLSVLAGIAAMQPKPILEKHLVFKPSRPLTSVRASPAIVHQGRVSTAHVQPLQAPGDLFYLTVVIDINDLTRSGVGAGAANNVATVERHGWASKDGVSWFFIHLFIYCTISENDKSNRQIPNTDFIGSTRKSPEEWTLQFRDLPEVNGRRTVTSRQMFDMDFKSGEALAFMTALDYSWVLWSPPLCTHATFLFFILLYIYITTSSFPHPKLLFSTISHTSSHLIAGHRLSHLSTSLLLYHPVASNSIAPSLGSGLSPGHAGLAPGSCPLDPLGGYILQASLMVQDVNKPELMTRGINELMTLKDMLKGVVDINVGDRLSLDTRVKEHLKSFGSIK